MASSSQRIVWLFWAVNLLFSAVYLGISMVTFHNVKSGTKHLRNFENRDAYKNSLLASCMLGFLIVLFWIVFSFFILIGKLFGDLPLGYGVMLGSCSHTGFFMLLAGLVLNTQETLADNFRKSRIWSQTDYNTYVATYAFSYILCGTYLLMFVMLLVHSGSMKTSRSDSYKASSGATPPVANPEAASGTTGPKPIPDNHGFGANWANSFRGSNV